MEWLDTLREIFTGNLTAALAGLWPILEPLWIALIAIVISAGCLASAAGRLTSGTVSVLVGAVFSLVLSGGVLENLGPLVDSSIATAGDLAGAAGASTDFSTPLQIAQAGADLAALAGDHATAIIGWAPWSWGLLPLLIWFTGLVLLLSYVLIAALSALAICELLVGAVVLSPGYVFLAVPGMQTLAYHPFGHLCSCVFRVAGLAFVAAYGHAAVMETFLPGMETELTAGDCLAAMAVATFLGLAALFGDRVITRALSGAAGFGSGVGPAVAHMISNAASAGSAAVSRGFGGGSAAAAGAAAGGGGGGGSFGGGGGPGGGGRPQTMSRASWVRRS
jgi:hypothetical protein